MGLCARLIYVWIVLLSIICGPRHLANSTKNNWNLFFVNLVSLALLASILRHLPTTNGINEENRITTNCWEKRDGKAEKSNLILGDLFSLSRFDYIRRLHAGERVQLLFCSPWTWHLVDEWRQKWISTGSYGSAHKWLQCEIRKTFHSWMSYCCAVYLDSIFNGITSSFVYCKT